MTAGLQMDVQRLYWMAVPLQAECTLGIAFAEVLLRVYHSSCGSKSQCSDPETGESRTLSALDPVNSYSLV